MNEIINLYVTYEAMQFSEIEDTVKLCVKV